MKSGQGLLLIFVLACASEQFTEPRPRLLVSVDTDPGAYPVAITVIRTDVDQLGQGGLVLGTISTGADELEIDDMPPGEYLMFALPAVGSGRACDGDLVGIHRITMADAWTIPRVRIVDDSRWVDVEVIDESGAAVGGVSVTAAAEVPLATSVTGPDGHCRLRVVGRSPIRVFAPPPFLSDPITILSPADGKARLATRPAGWVDFELRQPDQVSRRPARVRYVGAGALSGRQRELDLAQDSSWVLPSLLDLGRWTAHVLDAEGAIVAAQEFDLTMPGESVRLVFDL